MRCRENAVHHRIAHVQVGRRHIDFGAQHARAVGKFTRLHPFEQVQVFLDASIAVRARFPGFRQGAPVLTNLIGRLIVHIRFAGFDQLDGPCIHAVEIIGSVIQVRFPIETQPAYAVLDGVDIFLLLLRRVRVVEPQIACAAEFPGDPEIDADRLGVADVQIAVGLRRKARDDLRKSAFRQVGCGQRQ